MNIWPYSAASRAQILAGVFPDIADLLAFVAAEFDYERTMPGPTGELNRLRSEPRGTFICLSDDGESANYMAYVAMALVTGNKVVLVDNESLAERLVDAGVPEQAVITRGTLDASWDVDRLSGVAFSGPREVARELNRQVAARDGGILQFVWRDTIDPHLILRFVTERTVTINTAAIGGNADLLGLGAKH